MKRNIWTDIVILVAVVLGCVGGQWLWNVTFG